MVIAAEPETSAAIGRRLSRASVPSTIASPKIASTHPRGAILLEIILATSLFILGAAFVLDGLSGAWRGVHNAKLEADACDLAVTLQSHLQMGTLEKVNAGPVQFDLPDYADWTWQVEFTTVDDSQTLPQLQRMEVVIRHSREDFTHRATMLLWNNPNPPTTLDLAGLGGSLSSLPSAPAGGAGANGTAPASTGNFGGAAAQAPATGPSPTGSSTSQPPPPRTTPSNPRGGNR